MRWAFGHTNHGIFNRVDVWDVTFGEVPSQNALHWEVLTDKPRDFEGEVVDFDLALVLARDVHASSIATKESWTRVGAA